MAMATMLASACNALTGANDLAECTGKACDLDEDGGPTNVPPDAQVKDGGLDAGDSGGGVDASKDTGLDAPKTDTGADAGPGCNGAIACDRVVFVTAAQYQGNLGGIVGADQKCQTAADASTVARIKGRTFNAWVSTLASSVSARFPHATAPYRDASGALVASNWTDLTDGSLVTGIRLTELGVDSTNANTWTGTESNGANSTGTTCLDWTTLDASSKGTRGNIGGNGNGWSGSTTDDCVVTHPLYCFEY